MIAFYLFALSAAVLFYTFLVYPGIILFLGTRKNKSLPSRWTELPTVTMILAAHNEEAVIERKLQNALTLDYPEEKLDVIIVDDASTDGICKIISSIDSPRVTLLRQPARRGKTAALNLAVLESKGEVLVFTDANALYQPEAVLRLVASFDAERKVGVVCGELRYRKHHQASSDEESRYWNLEIKLKRAESNTSTLLGANGSIYAMPRELYIPLREDLISDFIGPLLLAQKGYRTIYQPLAISIEPSAGSLKSEFRRKRRIIQRSLHALSVHSELLNPFSVGWLAIQLWSHKLLRWLTPLWLFCLLIASFLLRGHPISQILFWCQLVIYFTGGIGIFIQTLGGNAFIFRFPAYFIMVLSAAISGIWGFLCGKRVITWEPQR